MNIIVREYGRIVWHFRWSFLVILLAMSAAVVLDLSIPILYKNIANALAKPFSDISYYVLMDNFIYLALFHSLLWLSWRGVEFGIIPFEAGGIRHLDQYCFSTLLKQRFSFFENNFSGSLVKQANRFTRSFEAIMDWLIFQLFGNLLALIIAFIIFAQQQLEFALYFLLWAVLFIAFSISYSLWKLKYDEQVASWDSKLGGSYSDAISNIAIVKSFALEPHEQRNIQVIAQSAYKSRAWSWVLMFIAFAIQGILTTGIELILVYLMIEKWRAGNFYIGEYVLLQSVLLLLIHRLWDFGRYFRNFFTAVAEAREMATILQCTDTEQNQANAKAYTIQHGAIHFEHLHFAYYRNASPDQPAQSGLFSDFSLSIQAGEKVALVGHSGSGKTSLTKLLFRFVEPQQGQVSFDGIAAQDFTLASLRSQISLVPQQPELFHRSIRDNIALGREVSEDELRTVAQKAQALEFIERLPDGFETLVGERGVKLSGGEKQRIAIARAFLQQAPIVVLDEATSALDSLTEQQIQVAIFELIANKTAIVIAHRLATILRMDRIIVLENGCIIEQGTHHELLAQQGYYYQMWQHQSGEFLKTDQDSHA